MIDLGEITLQDVALAPDSWFTLDEAAAYLKVSKPSLYRWMSEGKLKFYKLAGTGARRFKKTDLDDLLEPGEIWEAPAPRDPTLVEMLTGRLAARLIAIDSGYPVVETNLPDIAIDHAPELRRHLELMADVIGAQEDELRHVARSLGDPTSMDVGDFVVGLHYDWPAAPDKVDE